MEILTRGKRLELINRALNMLTGDINVLPGLLWDEDSPDHEPGVTFEQVQTLIDNDLRCLHNFVAELIAEEKERIRRDWDNPYKYD